VWVAWTVGGSGALTRALGPERQPGLWGAAGCRGFLINRGRGLERSGGGGRSFRYCLGCGVRWGWRVEGIRARLGLAPPSVLTFLLAAVTASSA
jgi:hypothetical protein